MVNIETRATRQSKIVVVLSIVVAPILDPFQLSVVVHGSIVLRIVNR